MTDWKPIALFEREARVLAQLNHPAIPRYLEYFHVDTASDRSFYIAQQLAPGESLAAFSSLLPSFLFLIFLGISRQLKMPIQKSLTIFITLVLGLTLLSFMTSGFLVLFLWATLRFVPIPNLLVSFLFFAFLGIYAPFGLRILDAFILSPISRTRLMIDQQYFSLQRWLLGSYLQNVTGCTSDISRVELRGIKPITVCMLRRGLRKHYFGSFLTQPEKEWLLWELRAFLEKGREHRA
jgi:hypothetical protein